MKNQRIASLIPQLRHIFLVALTFGLLALTTHSAQAIPTLTLDDPNPTLVVPSSGSITYTFTGTLSLDQGFSTDVASLDFVFINGASPNLIGTIINYPYSDADNGGTFVGGLFTVEIFSTSTLGFYNERFGGGPAIFKITESDGSTSTYATASYTVNLVASAGVPDGGSTLLLLVGALGTLGWLKRSGLQH